MRILILGDSLSFPMPKRGQPLEVTWPALLRRQAPNIEIWHRARPRWCAIDVRSEFTLFTDSLTRFDAVIVQTGIVDCVPRPYPRWFIKIFELFASFEQLRRFDRFTHRHLLWVYGHPWVSRGKFKEILGDIIRISARENPGLKVLFVAIAPPTRRLLEEFPGISGVALRYNETLTALVNEHRSTTTLINPFHGQDPLSLTLEDGHHLTIHAHAVIAQAIARTLIHPEGTPAPALAAAPAPNEFPVQSPA